MSNTRPQYRPRGGVVRRRPGPRATAARPVAFSKASMRPLQPTLPPSTPRRKPTATRPPRHKGSYISRLPSTRLKYPRAAFPYVPLRQVPQPAKTPGGRHWTYWPEPRRNVLIIPTEQWFVELPRELRLTLQQLGLTTPEWRQRLAAANEPLQQFMRRFYGNEGFAQVVEDYLRGGESGRVARLLVRWANRRAARSPRVIRSLRFETARELTQDGHTVKVVSAVDTERNVLYKFLPWAHISAPSLRRRVRSDRTRVGRGARVRYVFLGRTLRNYSDTISEVLRGSMLPTPRLRHESTYRSSRATLL